MNYETYLQQVSDIKEKSVRLQFDVVKQTIMIAATVLAVLISLNQLQAGTLPYYRLGLALLLLSLISGTLYAYIQIVMMRKLIRKMVDYFGEAIRHNDHQAQPVTVRSVIPGILLVVCLLSFALSLIVLSLPVLLGR